MRKCYVRTPGCTRKATSKTTGQAVSRGVEHWPGPLSHIVGFVSRLTCFHFWAADWAAIRPVRRETARLRDK